MHHLSWDGLKIALGIIGATIAGLWGGLTVMVQILVILMVLDIATGLLAATVAKVLDSSVGFRGMCRKAIVLLVVTAAAALSSILGDLPLAEIVAGFYCAVEGLSIMENAARAGVPIPKVLKEALIKLKQSGEGEPGLEGG